MTWIQFDVSVRAEVMRANQRWRHEHRREQTQIGSTTWLEVEESPGVMQFPGVFVDELERLGIPFERLRR